MQAKTYRSSMTTKNSSSGGVGFVGLLTILFIGLKLTSHITWSWFWVLSPLVFSFGMFVVFLIVCVFVAAFSKPKPPKSRFIY
jgi:predicted tellurium resistance membrane protein TerC